MNKSDKLKLCSGCRQNFYNGNNGMGIKECWSLKSARKVRRWRIGWWTPMTSKDGFIPVTTLSCHVETGTAAFMERLPRHLGSTLPPREKRVK